MNIYLILAIGVLLVAVIVFAARNSYARQEWARVQQENDELRAQLVTVKTQTVDPITVAETVKVQTPLPQRPKDKPKKINWMV